MFGTIFKSSPRGAFDFVTGVRWLGGRLFVECKALALPPAVKQNPISINTDTAIMGRVEPFIASSQELQFTARHYLQ